MTTISVNEITMESYAEAQDCEVFILHHKSSVTLCFNWMNKQVAITVPKNYLDRLVSE